ARLPGHVMFQLTDKETESLIFQSGRSKGRGGRRHRPYAFTEQDVAMLSSVLNSERAVQVNIAIMRTFVQLRRLMDSNADLARKIESLEKKYDEKFATVFAAILNPTEQIQNEDDNENSSEQTVRPVTESITAGRERSYQEQDENDKKN